MTPLRLGLLTSAVSALVSCSMILSPGELSNGEDETLAEVDSHEDGGKRSKDGASGTDPGDEDSDTTGTGEPDPGGDDSGTADTPETGTETPADTGTPNPCAGKANGFRYKAGDNTAACCGGQPTKINTTSNCGACGIACTGGFACGNPMPGQWGCTCSLNSQCQTIGYGGDSTCYILDGKGFCNCQCPGGTETCNGVCKNGAVCHDITGQNYCAYP